METPSKTSAPTTGGGGDGAPDLLAAERFRVFQEQGERGGNRMLLYEGPGGERALLKLYRRRGSALREGVKNLASGLAEGRIGVTARQRCALERRHLAIWAQHGFDAPRRLDWPLPAGVDPETASWIEYCEGPLLSRVIADRRRPRSEKLALVERLARAHGRRHAVALDSGDLGLVLEHASVKHVIVSGDRLVHFDLETAFDPRVAPLDALARELASMLRSMRRHGQSEFEPLGRRFVESYPDPKLLRRLAEHGTSRTEWRARARRWIDRHQRGAGTSKTDALDWLLSTLGSGEA